MFHYPKGNSAMPSRALHYARAADLAKNGKKIENSKVREIDLLVHLVQVQHTHEWDELMAHFRAVFRTKGVGIERIRRFLRDLAPIFQAFQNYWSKKNKEIEQKKALAKARSKKMTEQNREKRDTLMFLNGENQALTALVATVAT